MCTPFLSFFLQGESEQKDQMSKKPMIDRLKKKVLCQNTMKENRKGIKRETSRKNRQRSISGSSRHHEEAKE